MSKANLLLILVAVTGTAFGQIANDNTMKAHIDGTEFTTQPRRVRVGQFWWITANTSKPDKMLRISLISYNRQGAIEPGTYLLVDADKPDTRENKRKFEELASTYKGLAIIKYVEETREPRMEYHVGKSRNGDDTIEVKTSTNTVLEVAFSSTLAGSHWKEKTTATVFGGLGRLVNKMEDKAITGVSGYDWDIDPEGNGYKKQGKEDEIVITDGVVRLNIK